ncbi:MAG TPA: GDSL-type esterase/lipase family protein [Verrucomicrobiota bacterium]|nr:GDSL-type esterase/lipase family protein [Verrucomicrobiota bacterium]
MQRRDFIRVTAVGALAAALPVQARQRLRPAGIKGTIRIACVGDSITWGAGVEDRERNHYPAVVQQILGTGYDVRNFGVSGATLLKRGDLPYWDTPAFAESTALRPHAVVIKLGTNDSKPQNWRYRADFPRDAFALVRHYLRLRPAAPLVYLCTPVPVMREAFGINGIVVEREIAPALRRVAQDTGVALVDLFIKLAGVPHHFPDGIHPNAAGAAFIADAVADALGGVY